MPPTKIRWGEPGTESEVASGGGGGAGTSAGGGGGGGGVSFFSPQAVSAKAPATSKDVYIVYFIFYSSFVRVAGDSLFIITL